MAGVLLFGIWLDAAGPGPAEAATRQGKGRATAAREARRARNALPDDPATALRLALAARSKGEIRLASKRFEAVAEQSPVIADHADLLRAQMLFEDGKSGDAVGICLRSLDANPKSPLRGQIYELLGRSRARLGDQRGAQVAFLSAIEETRDSDRRAPLRLLLGSSYERSDFFAQAAGQYRILWTSHAARPESALAAERLDALEKMPGIEPRNARDWRRRADNLFRSRHNEEALAAYERALELGLSKSDDERARKQRAHTLFRLREYPEAVEAFTSLPQHDDVPLWRARSLARADQVPLAVEEFEALAEKSRGELGIRATYLAGLLLDGRGKRKQADAAFDRVSRNRASPGLSRAATWRLGWSAFRAGEDKLALKYFDRLLKRERGEIDRLRTRYWRARALERLDKGDHQAEFTRMAQDFPFSYYGWRARSRAQPEPAVERQLQTEAGDDRLDADQLARPHILLAAGLVELAIEEMRLVSRRADGLRDRLSMAQLYSEASQYHSAQRLIVEAYQEELSRGPIARLEELWWHAWPAAFRDKVEHSTQKPDSVEPALVFAIMREESGYRPEVLSVSGARGLLQIMIPTGERLAQDLGVTGFEADDLFDPATNIRLGSHYLWQLSERFDGRLSASIASYNAGPEAVSSWLGPDAPSDDDEWVESIPYDQTRGYVKRVLRSMHAYQVLY